MPTPEENIAAMGAKMEMIYEEVQGGHEFRERVLLAVQRVTDGLAAHDTQLSELREKVGALTELRQKLAGVVLTFSILSGLIGAIVSLWWNRITGGHQ